MPDDGFPGVRTLLNTVCSSLVALQERVDQKLNKPSMWAQRTPEDAARHWAQEFPGCPAAAAGAAQSPQPQPNN